MPFTNFQQVFEKVKSRGPATLALAAAGERNSLLAVQQGMQQGLVQRAILVGDQAKIESISKEIGLSLQKLAVYHQPEEAEAAKTSVRLVREGKAQVLMKGLVHTADFLRALLNRQEGLRLPERLLSHVYILEAKLQGRFILVTDSAFNINPDVEAKAKIAANAAWVARRLGVARPRVAALAAVEVVNPKMQATLDAAELSRRSQAGLFPDFVVQGPLGLDNAVSPDAAAIKGIQGKVAGLADVLLMPDIESGNIFSKGFSFIAGGILAGVLVGASAPVVLTSRADTDKAKLYSIAVAMLLAEDHA